MLHQDQLNSRLFKAAQDGDANALSQALAEGANARAYDSAALAPAAEKGHAARAQKAKMNPRAKAAL